MAFLTTSRAILTKLESTPGTAAVMTSVEQENRIRELDFKVEVAVDSDTSKFLTGDLAGNDESITGKKTGTASYKIKLTAGEFEATGDTHKLTYGIYLENAGLNKVGIGTTDVTDTSAGDWVFYPSVDAASKTMTLDIYEKDPSKLTAIKSEIIGAMSNLTISADGVGAPFVAAFEAKGRVDAVVSVATADIPEFDDANVMRIVADKFLSTTIKVTDLSTDTAVEFCASKLSLESGNEISELECQATAAGILNNTITAQNPKLVIDPLLKTLEEFNYWNALTQEKFYKIEVISTDMTIYIPRAQLMSSSVADSNGFLRNEMSFRCLRNIDSDKPAVVTTEIAAAKLPQAMYFIVIGEKAAQY